MAMLADAAGLSQGMLSKIETGQTSPSLGTLASLAETLAVPLSSFFSAGERSRDVSFVPAGEGIHIDRRGTRAGHLYQLLGHSVRGDVNVEPYLITLDEAAETYRYFHIKIKRNVNSQIMKMCLLLDRNFKIVFVATVEKKQFMCIGVLVLRF